jgi:hypothetical protein
MARLFFTKGVALAVFLAGLILSGSAIAQEATPVPGPGLPPPPAGCAVIADGLMSPRFVAIAEDGTVYVTETGTGGDELVARPVPANWRPRPRRTRRRPRAATPAR